MTTLAVDRIELERVDVALPTAVGAGAHRTTTRALLRLRAWASGRQRRPGLGEASPLPGYSSDSLDECAAALRALPLPLVLDADLATIARFASSLPPAARAALECALLDLVGQAEGRPLWEILRSRGATGLRLSRALVSDDLVSEADAAIRSGAATLKRKIAPRALERELHELAVVRRVHPDVALRVDLNRSLSRAEFDAVAPRLRALALDFVEEPFAESIEDGDARAWPPIALDESLAAPGAAVALDRVCAVVLKPTRDGLLGALGRADAARRAGLRVVVTHTWEGAIGHLAAIHLAIALGDAHEAHGLGLQPVSAGGPGSEALHELVVGHACARPHRPGLGA